MQQFLKFIILAFIYSSTGFERLHAHHQELNNCSSSLWFYLRSVVIAVLLVMVGPALTFRYSVFCEHCIYVFCVDLRTNSDYFCISH